MDLAVLSFCSVLRRNDPFATDDGIFESEAELIADLTGRAKPARLSGTVI
jgi:hypothetical protein